MGFARGLRAARLRPGLVRAATLTTCSIAALAIAGLSPALAGALDLTATGFNAAGQLADGTATGPEICFFYFVGSEEQSAYCSHFAEAVEGLHDVSAVSAGTEHTLALLSDGTVVAWGDNSDGELGDGSVGGLSTVPVPVSGLSGVTAVSAGDRYSLALLADGTVVAWGDNNGGELGDGSVGGVSPTPVAVAGLAGVKAISASERTNYEGDNHSLALLEGGQVMAWGNNEHGALGTGSTGGLQPAPVPVSGLEHAVAIATGSASSLALREDGTAVAWGDNEHGQLGDGTTADSDLPVAVSGLSGATAIAAGAEHSLALLAGGTVAAWGANYQGQLGDGTARNIRTAPVAVTGLSGVAEIAAGGYTAGGEAEHSLARLGDGTVEAWGAGQFGELGAFGAGNSSESHVPVPVLGLTSSRAISAGAAHSISLGDPFPSIASIAPSSGPAAGGTTVTLTGANLEGATAVHFGTAAASAFTVESPTSITAVSPPGTGVVDITVTTPGGTSIPSSYRFATADRYTYLPAPAVRTITPKKGPAAGGTTVTIKGSNFEGASAVNFGSTPASEFTVVSATSILAVSPPGEPGAVDVTVVGPGGTSATSKPDRFTWGPPVVSGLSPATGPASGGTSVTVTGSGFGPGTAATSFKFGTAPASSVDCSSTTTCLVTSPAHKPGTVDVVARVNGKNGKKTPSTDQFTFG